MDPGNPGNPGNWVFDVVAITEAGLIHQSMMLRLLWRVSDCSERIGKGRLNRK